MSNRKVKASTLEDAQIHGTNWNKDFLTAGKSLHTKKVMINLLASMENGEWNPYALAAKVYDDLNPSWEMAMNGPFPEGDIEAQRLEI